MLRSPTVLFGLIAFTVTLVIFSKYSNELSVNRLSQYLDFVLKSVKLSLSPISARCDENIPCIQKHARATFQAAGGRFHRLAGNSNGQMNKKKVQAIA